MTLLDLSPRVRPLSERERIEAIVSHYGVRRVLRAALMVAIRKRRRRVARAFDHDLTDYIRRDIGLPPKVEPPGPHRYL